MRDEFEGDLLKCDFVSHLFTYHSTAEMVCQPRYNVHLLEKTRIIHLFSEFPASLGELLLTIAKNDLY